MKIRTFLILLVLLLLTTGSAVLAIRNQQALAAPFQVTGTFSVPVYAVLGGGFLAGALVVLAGSIFRDSRDLLHRLEGLRGSKERKHLEDLYRQGMEAVLEGLEERALVHFQAILAADPSNVDALIKTGQVHRALKQLDEAVECHRKAHRLRPDDLEPYYELVKDYEAQGRIDKCKVVLNRIIQIRPRKALSAYRKLRKYAMKEGDWARAAEIQALIEDQTEKTPYKVQAERRFSLGILYQIALDKVREGRGREGANMLRKLVRSDPQFVPAHVRLGEALIAMGQPTAGVEAWARGFEATGSPAFLTFMENHFLQASEPDQAIEALQTAVARSTSDFLPRLFLAQLFLRLEMIDEAHREFRALRDRASASPSMHAFLAAIEERRGAYREAAGEYREALRLLDLPHLFYRCAVCSTRYPGWEDRCSVCLEWSQIVLDFGEDPTLEEMGSLPGPIYSGVP
jgi:lipopolysaccharide biosynthesis regulator YciM